MSISWSIVIDEAARGCAARGATVAEVTVARRASGIVDVRRIGDLRGEDTAARAARDDAHAAAVGLRDPAGDGQAEARAAGAPRGVQPDEAFEHALAIFGRDARAGIRDAQQDPVLGFHERDVDGSPPGRIRQGVAEQIGEHPPEERFVPSQRHGLERRAHRDGLLAGARRELAHAFLHERRHVDARHDHRVTPAVRARQHEHVVDEARQARRLLRNRPERLAVLRFVARRLAQRHVGGRPHDRDRRAQLVRRVRHEAPLRRQGAAKPVQDAVERPGELLELFSRSRHGQPSVERLRGNGLRLGGHRGQRAQAMPSQPQSPTGGEDERKRDADQARLQQGLPLLGRLVERRADSDKIPGALRRSAPHRHAPRSPVGTVERARHTCDAGRSHLGRQRHRPRTLGNRRTGWAQDLHDVVPGTHDLGHRPRRLSEIFRLGELLVEDVVRRRADGPQAIVELLDEQAPVQPEDRGAEHRDGEHEQD